MPVEIRPIKKYSDAELNKKFSIKRGSIISIGDLINVASPFDNNFTFYPMPLINVDIFPSHLTQSLISLSVDIVQKQACEIVYSLYRILNDLMLKEHFTNYLSKLHITEQEDKTGLIEWNFEKFRIGFSIEFNPSESGYYLISADPVTNDFIMKTGRIGSRCYEILENMVKYVLENT
jgi:hypothetical protein